MGRTPLSGLPLLWRLERAGHAVQVFGYSPALETFEGIRARLRRRLERLAGQGDYALVGHSLGGVLLRGALGDLPPEVPRPRRLFLLGSPLRVPRLARRLRRRCLYRILAGDCGQLLASGRRLGAIGPVEVPTTGLVGISGPRRAAGPFGHEPNDGIVAESEVRAAWVGDVVRVPVLHTFLPSSGRVAEILLDRLA